MTKFITYIFILVIISNHALANVEKGKWNFVKDSDYCYIGSAPILEEIPEGKKRDDPYILVYRINRNPNAVIQVNAGYPYKDGESVSVKIDKKNYVFYSEADSAWTENDNEIIYAMKMGVSLIVKGTSSRGTETIDTYSLKGFTAAFNKLTNDC